MSDIFALDMLGQAVHDLMARVVRSPVVHKYQILCIYVMRYPTLLALSFTSTSLTNNNRFNIRPFSQCVFLITSQTSWPYMA